MENKALDDKKVDFSDIYELEHILRQLKKSQSKHNILLLRSWEEEAKNSYGKEKNQHLTHKEFYKYIKDNTLASHLDDAK